MRTGEGHEVQQEIEEAVKSAESLLQEFKEEMASYVINKMFTAVNETFSARIDEATAYEANVRQKLQESSSEINERLEKLRSELEEYHQELAAQLEADVADSRELIACLKNGLWNLTKRLKSSEQILTTTEGKMAQLHNGLRGVKEDLGEEGKRVEDLSKSLGELRGELEDAFEKALEGMEETIIRAKDYAHMILKAHEAKNDTSLKAMAKQLELLQSKVSRRIRAQWIWLGFLSLGALFLMFSR